MPPKKRLAALPDTQVGGTRRSVFQTDRAQPQSHAPLHFPHAPCVIRCKNLTQHHQISAHKVSNEALPPTNGRVPARWRPSVAPVQGQEPHAQRQVLIRPPAYGGFIAAERLILHYHATGPLRFPATAGFIPVER